MLDNNKIKIINFLQDFGCARLKHLQILFDDRNNNFNNIITSRMVSKKGDVFVHNTGKIDNKMLTALDILCEYKDNLKNYYINYRPIYISFMKNNNEIYHIIVSDKEDERGIVKVINNLTSIPYADKYILAFQDKEQLNNIKIDKPYLYCTYPDLEIIE